ncbi:MAG: putative surface protein responsible for cell interaction [Herbinix sp.]|jgi:hypothetical protein|nr:putative surface protein responsible for cell interaction [Herbinix sp.]
MNKIKKLLFTVLLLIAMVTSSAAPIFSSTHIAQAATIKISNRSLTLEVGKVKTLKITGTSKKIIWSSSKKTVATVSSKGKVTAKIAGTTTITATVAGKKLTCKLTVKEPANPYLKDAPFKATEIKIENIDFIMPSDWDGTYDLGTQNDLYVSMHPLDTTISSLLTIHIVFTNEKAPDYRVLKKELSTDLTLEKVQQSLIKSVNDPNVILTDFVKSDYEAPFGNVLKAVYNINSKGEEIQQAVYYFYLDNYYLEVKATDNSEIDIETMTDYMISSIIIK